MIIEEKNGNVYLKEVANFDLAQTFDCGQCFRFNRTDDGSFCGVAFGKYIKLNSIKARYGNCLSNTHTSTYLYAFF